MSHDKTSENKMPSLNSSDTDRYILGGTDVGLLAQTAKEARRISALTKQDLYRLTSLKLARINKAWLH